MEQRLDLLSLKESVKKLSSRGWGQLELTSKFFYGNFNFSRIWYIPASRERFFNNFSVKLLGKSFTILMYTTVIVKRIASREQISKIEKIQLLKPLCLVHSPTVALRLRCFCGCFLFRLLSVTAAPGGGGKNWFSDSHTHLRTQSSHPLRQTTTVRNESGRAALHKYTHTEACRQQHFPIGWQAALETGTGWHRCVCALVYVCVSISVWVCIAPPLRPHTQFHIIVVCLSGNALIIVIWVSFCFRCCPCVRPSVWGESVCVWAVTLH